MTDQVNLVANGTPQFCIEVRPSQDAEALLPILDELVLHLERCLDDRITWFNRKTKDKCPLRLVVHFAPEAGLDRQAFEIIATQEEIILRAGTLGSLHNAVYTFLSEAFGIRWLWPGETGVVTPRATNVSWPVGSKLDAPDWLWRRLWTGGAFWTEDDATLAELKRGVSIDILKELQLWQQRNRLGGLTISDGHRWSQICSPLIYGEAHPDYFALVDGKRDATYFNGKHQNQPCTSNPEVIQLTADYIIAQFHARPELDGFSFAVNDGGGFCECDACLAQDVAADENTDADTFTDVTNEAAPGHAAGARSITDRMFTFANKVAECVAAIFPEKLLLFLVYGPYRQPPEKARLHPNVIAQFCAMSWSHAAPDIAERDHGIFNRLGNYADHLGIYEYFVNSKNGSMPRGFARTFHRSLQSWHEMGGCYFATQSGLDFATNGLAYATAARALWNTEEPFETILDDYCHAGFGPAAQQVKQYLTAFLDRWEETEGGRSLGNPTVEHQAPRLYDAEWRMARRQELNRALDAKSLNSSQADRVQFLSKGLDYLDLLCAACAAVNHLIDLGAPLDLETTPAQITEWKQTPKHCQAVEVAILHRCNLLEWMIAHRDGFYIATMWAEYQRLMRHTPLGHGLDRLGSAGD
jgi:Domain of unknown function (DUF4838)